MLNENGQNLRNLLQGQNRSGGVVKDRAELVEINLQWCRIRTKSELIHQKKEEKKYLKSVIRGMIFKSRSNLKGSIKSLILLAIEEEEGARE